MPTKSKLFSLLNNKNLDLDFKVFGKVFIVTFFICILIYIISILFQYKKLFLGELNDSINNIYVSTENLVELDKSVKGILSTNKINFNSLGIKDECKSNDQILINEKLLNICFNSRELNYSLDFKKDFSFVIREILYGMPYMLIISLLTIVFLLISNSKIFKKSQPFPIDRDRIIFFVNSTINDLNNMLLNYTLSNFNNTLDKLYDYSIMFIDLSPQNLHLIETKLKKLIETAKTLYLDDQANSIHLLAKEIEIYYYKKVKKNSKLVSSYFMMITSRYYTSKSQLGLFILFFGLINAFYLMKIYEIPRFVDNSFIYYLAQVMSILSNLGGSIDFATNFEYFYLIVLQLIGIVFFGILLGIITKEIR